MALKLIECFGFQSAAKNMFDNKSVLITGGTGSFGNMCTRNILKEYKPRRLVIFLRDELKQYEMQQRFDSEVMRYFIGDVRDGERLRQAMEGTDIVIHAAALKRARENPVALKVLAAVTGLAHNLGVTVCAEGVEDAETYKFLSSISCDKMQGYLISEAVMPDIIKRVYSPDARFDSNVA